MSSIGPTQNNPGPQGSSGAVKTSSRKAGATGTAYSMTVIRTPHGLLDLRALDAWNRRNARSRAEYAAHEFAGHTDRYLKTCDHCTAAKENR